MTPKEALAVLIAAFREEKIQEPSVRMYEQKLRDIPGPLLEATVNRLIDVSVFFPRIAEIRRTAAHLAGLLPAPAAQALAIVRAADVERPVYRRPTIGNGPYGERVLDEGDLAYVEREWWWPTDVDEVTMAVIKATLARVGDPVGRDGRGLFAWETGFAKTYEQVAADVERMALADLSQAALPAPPRPALEAGETRSLPVPACAAGASGPPGTGEPEPPPTPTEAAEARVRVRAIIDSLGARRAMPGAKLALAGAAAPPAAGGHGVAVVEAAGVDARSRGPVPPVTPIGAGVGQRPQPGSREIRPPAGVRPGEGGRQPAVAAKHHPVATQPGAGRTSRSRAGPIDRSHIRERTGP